MKQMQLGSSLFVLLNKSGVIVCMKYNPLY